MAKASPIFSFGDVETFHRHLEKRVAKLAGTRVRISAIPDWRRAAIAEISFDLYPFERSPRGRREFGGSCATVPLFTRGLEDPDLPRAWASWQDNWRRESRNSVTFRSAGWTVYLGYEEDEEAEQVLRAEWQQHEGESPHGQPHWHVDRDLYYKRPMSDAIIGETPDLVELAPLTLDPIGADVTTSTASLPLGKFHLAMGGWDNHPEGIPKCWQRSVSHLSDHLLEWSISTLSYIRSQLSPQRKMIRTYHGP